MTEDRCVEAEVESGIVRGIDTNGVHRFLGIPYAAAPSGALRFELPAPPDSWGGARDATTMGPTPPQAPYAGRLSPILPSLTIPGDEYLNVNVWAPTRERPAEGYPVLVWFPGGALTRGSNALDVYDGSAFARDGVTVVSVNYRLGVEGFAVLPDAPHNRGLADQVAALAWVRRNIATFGGNPTTITIAGQSAGGSCVAAHLAHPETRRHVAGAIIQSAPLSGTPDPSEDTLTARIACELGIEPTRAAFAQLTPAQIVEAQTKVIDSPAGVGGAGFGAVVDGATLPTPPDQALLSGAGANVPLMIGGTADEHRLWGLPDDVGRMLIDQLLTKPADELADARLRHGGRTWRYTFDWRSREHDLGSAHGMDLPFVFETVGTDGAAPLVGTDAPRHLARRVHAHWVDFVRTGDPGWTLWDDRRICHRLAADHKAVEA